jgi:hypothetical protein
VLAEHAFTPRALPIFCGPQLGFGCHLPNTTISVIKARVSSASAGAGGFSSIRSSANVSVEKALAPTALSTACGTSCSIVAHNASFARAISRFRTAAYPEAWHTANLEPMAFLKGLER